MVGNVWQWCSDAYDNYPVGDVTDPQAMTPGARPAVRGGCFLDGPATFRAALRHWNDQGSRYVQLGFRVVAAD